MPLEKKRGDSLFVAFSLLSGCSCRGLNLNETMRERFQRHEALTFHRYLMNQCLYRFLLSLAC